MREIALDVLAVIFWIAVTLIVVCILTNSIFYLRNAIGEFRIVVCILTNSIFYLRNAIGEFRLNRKIGKGCLGPNPKRRVRK
jgi:hypothetical protein